MNKRHNIIIVGLSLLLLVGCGDDSNGPALSIGGTTGGTGTGSVDTMSGDVVESTDEDVPAPKDLIEEEQSAPVDIAPDVVMITSCEDRCGEAASDSACGCTPECTQDDPCCDDYEALCVETGECGDGTCDPGEEAECEEDCGEPPVASCEGRCGEYKKGAPCQCDDECWKFEDCCDDLGEVCTGGPICGDGDCEQGETEVSCPSDCAEVEGPLACVFDNCDMDGCDAVPGCLVAVECLLSCFDPDSAEACTMACIEGQPFPAQAILWEIATCTDESGCAEEPECGNGVCTPGESFATCPDDCEAPAECGNDECEDGESPANCPEDCEGGGGGSCEGKCGGQSGQGCWCDNQCTNLGDCCDDYVLQCTDTAPETLCLNDSCPTAVECLAVPQCKALLECVVDCGATDNCVGTCVADAPTPAQGAVWEAATCGKMAGCFDTDGGTAPGG